MFSSFFRWNVFHCVYHATSCPVLWVDSTNSVTLHEQNPRDQEREYRPCVGLHVELCETEVCFLDVNLVGTNVWLPKIEFLRGRFWFFKIHSKIGILEQSQSAMLCSISHMTILPEITRAVNIRNQTSQASVTSSFHFCNCLFQFAYQPQNVGSTNACQLQTFQDDLRADSWCGDLYHCSIVLQRISLHVPPCCRTMQ